MLKKLVTTPIFNLYKKALPKMSQTEREALEAGNIWWDAELLRGNPDWFYFMTTESRRAKNHNIIEEQKFIDITTDELCSMLDDYQITHVDKDLPSEVWQFMKENKFFGMIIPKEYGGLDFSHRAHSDIVMKIASRSISAAVTVMVPNSLGPGKLILKYGTQHQKDYYLPRLASGEEIPCFALTSPKAGSDAGGIEDSGTIVERDGKLGVVLNWDKRYITLGPVATLLGLAFKLYDPDGLIGDQKDLGISVALVPTNTPGVTIGERHNPLGAAFMNGPTNGNNVFIPLDNLIGGIHYKGKGWKMLVECLTTGRAISLPALAVGGAKLASRYTGAYSRIRHQFGLPIGKFEGIQEALARIAGHTYMMDATRVVTLNALDRGIQPSVISAIVKYHLTELGRDVMKDAMDVQAGSGICLGDKNPIGNVNMAMPISITVEGANILTRNMIIFGQGVTRCHPYVMREINTVQHDNIDVFHHVFWSHVGYTIGNIFKTPFTNLTNGALTLTGHTIPRELKKYVKQINKLSASLALVSDLSLLILGGKLKRKERLSARLGDVLSNLYMASCVVKQYSSGCMVSEEPQKELALAEWSLQMCLYRAGVAFDDFFRNFPVWGRIMRMMVFPYGMRYKKPNDKLDAAVAHTIFKLGAGETRDRFETRDRLTSGIYMPNRVNEQVAFVDKVFEELENSDNPLSDMLINEAVQVNKYDKL